MTSIKVEEVDEYAGSQVCVMCLLVAHCSGSLEPREKKEKRRVPGWGSSFTPHPATMQYLKYSYDMKCMYPPPHRAINDIAVDL
jgi:hypothetical protein